MIRVSIARGAGDLFEARLYGPGGWMTLVSQASLDDARHHARSAAQVLGVKAESDVEGVSV